MYYQADKGPAAASSFINDGQTASCWFWCYKDQDATRCAWLAAKVEFRQVGSDVSARIVKAGYQWLDKEYWGTDGSKIDFEKAGVTQTEIYDEKDHPGGPTTGLKNLLAISSYDAPLVVADRTGSDGVWSGALPPDPSDKNTGTPVVICRNAKLAEVEDFTGATLYYYTEETGGAATPCHVVRGDGTATVQFQRIRSNVRLCVKVAFADTDDGITACAQYARYDRAPTLGGDFDKSYEGSYNIHDDIVDRKTAGLALAAIRIDWKRTQLTFADRTVLEGPFMVQTPTLALTGDEVVAPASAAGTVSFAPAGGAVQLIRVTAADCEIPSAVFSGTTAFSFADGATLSLAAIDLDAADAIYLPADLADDALRIGTSATLTHAERAKFRCDGYRTVQDENGYLHLVRTHGMMLIFR